MTTDILRLAVRKNPASKWVIVCEFAPADEAQARRVIAEATRLDPRAEWRIETRMGRVVKAAE